MKSNIMTVAKKELTRIISDKNLFFSAVLLPGLIIFLAYFGIGQLQSMMLDGDEDYIHQVHVVNMPQSIEQLLSIPELRLNLLPTDEAQIQDIRTQIENQETDALIVFPLGFDETVAVFDPATSTEPAPRIAVYANGARSESAAAGAIIMAIIEEYHHSLTHRFVIDRNELATDADLMGMLMGALLPMMLVVMIVEGARAIASESLAGEKERGTLATLLVTPSRRSDIALGKLIAISAISVLGAIGAIIGSIAGMPSLLGLELSDFLGVFNASDYGLLLLVAVSNAVMVVSMFLIVSALAKNVKQSNAYAMPFMFIAMMFGMGSSLINNPSIALYLVPFLNSALNVLDVINGNVNFINMGISIGANILVAVICTFVIAKMMNSEKIVFDK